MNGTLAINRTLGSASVGINKFEVPGHVTVGPGGTLKGSGIVRGKVRVLSSGNNQIPPGRIFPGTSPGTLTIDGDYEQTGGLWGSRSAAPRRDSSTCWP